MAKAKVSTKWGTAMAEAMRKFPNDPVARLKFAKRQYGAARKAAGFKQAPRKVEKAKIKWSAYVQANLRDPIKGKKGKNDKKDTMGKK